VSEAVICQLRRLYSIESPLAPQIIAPARICSPAFAGPGKGWGFFPASLSVLIVRDESPQNSHPFLPPQSTRLFTARVLALARRVLGTPVRRKRGLQNLRSAALFNTDSEPRHPQYQCTHKETQHCCYKRYSHKYGENPNNLRCTRNLDVSKQRT
jgi:hypothetical protein